MKTTTETREVLKTAYGKVFTQGRQSTSTTSENIMKFKGNIHADYPRMFVRKL